MTINSPSVDCDEYSSPYWHREFGYVPRKCDLETLDTRLSSRIKGSNRTTVETKLILWDYSRRDGWYNQTGGRYKTSLVNDTQTKKFHEKERYQVEILDKIELSIILSPTVRS